MHHCPANEEHAKFGLDAQSRTGDWFEKYTKGLLDEDRNPNHADRCRSRLRDPGPDDARRRLLSDGTAVPATRRTRTVQWLGFPDRPGHSGREHARHPWRYRDRTGDSKPRPESLQRKEQDRRDDLRKGALADQWPRDLVGSRLADGLPPKAPARPNSPRRVLGLADDLLRGHRQCG